MIALVHGHRAWGAVEEYAAAVARSLGDEALVLHPDAPALRPFAEIGVPTEPYPQELLESAPGLARDLGRRLRRHRARIVHVTDALPPALVAARLAGVRRLLVTHHTPELPRSDNIAGRLWWRLGWLMRPLVVYTSETDRERDRRRSSRVVPLGIDVERFQGGRRVLEGKVVGNVARLAEQKGHDTLLEAVPLILQHHPDVRFVIAGDGELRQELEQKANELCDHVVMLGNRADVPDLLASFAVFAYPSRYEGMCLAVVEAQAAGVPVVATPVGAIRESVVDGETGLLVRPDDPVALAAAIVRLLDDPALASRLAAAGREQAGRFTVQRMVAETLALYDSMR